MKKNHIKILGLSALFSSGFFYSFAGNGGNGNDKKAANDAKIEKALKTVAFYQDDIVKEVMKSIPSPVELSTIMKEINTDYDKSVLCNPDNAKKYNTEYKQALNLGLYSTDLGYASIYKKRQDALAYLNSVRDIAKELTLGNFFDAQSIKESNRMLENDSLVHYATVKFDEINGHLVNQSRQNVSILMLTGGWVEALHLAGKVYEKKPAAVLKEKIGEQKYALDQIIIILNLYSDKNQYKTIVSKMNDLQEIFNGIEVRYTAVPGGVQESYDKEGLPVFSGGEVSEVLITDKHIKEIKDLVGKIRAEIIEY